MHMTNQNVRFLPNLNKHGLRPNWLLLANLAASLNYLSMTRQITDSVIESSKQPNIHNGVTKPFIRRINAQGSSMF